MADTILQRFLDQGLIEIGDEDEKLKHLQKASQDIMHRLQRKRLTVIPTTLAALDPEIAPDDPILLEAEASLKKHWATVRNRYGGTPRQILRPILIDALQSAGRADTSVAAIIWLTGSSVVPQIDLGREAQIGEAWLKEMGAIAETQAAQEWSQPASYKPLAPPSFELEISGIDISGVDEAALTKHLAAATGPQTEDGNATGPDRNPHWPNNGPPWSYHFASRAAVGFAEVIDASQGAVQEYIDHVIKQVQTALSEYVVATSAALNEVLLQAQGGAYERRTRLLWWKEALYSPTLKRSYRVLAAPLAALWMAYDLHCEVPQYCPQSVEFFLRETVRAVIGSDAETTTLTAFCLALQASAAQLALPPRLRAKVVEAKRGPLLALVRHALSNPQITDDDVRSRLGIEGQRRLNLSDLAVWLFRDLQAERLAEAK